MQALHRLRESAVDDRTALVNQVCGLLSEFGIIFNQGIKNIREGLPSVLEDAENYLNNTFREALALKYTQLLQLDESVKKFSQLITQASEAHKEIKLLQSIPEFGPIVSSCFFSIVCDGEAFSKSRDVAASLGLMPRQYSTGAALP